MKLHLRLLGSENLVICKEYNEKKKIEYFSGSRENLRFTGTIITEFDDDQCFCFKQDRGSSFRGEMNYFKISYYGLLAFGYLFPFGNLRIWPLLYTSFFIRQMIFYVSQTFNCWRRTFHTINTQVEA